MAQVAQQKPVEKKKRRSASQWAVAWRRFKRNKAALVGMFMVGVLFFVAAFSPFLAKYPARPDSRAFTPFYNGDTGVPPSWEYPLGTTSLGTDVYSEIIHGSVFTIYVALGVTSITMALAIVVGVVAGYFGKYVDDVLMRIAEVFLVFPSLLLILVFARIFQLSVGTPYWSVLGIQIPIGLTMVILIIAVFGWAGDARLVRGEVLRVRELEFVQAEKALGASRMRILFRHIFPNVLSPIIVVATLTMASAVLVEAGVSFLGFGDPNTVTWGRILEENFQYINTVWWAEVFPGLAVLWTVLGFNLMGDGLSDALNPRLRE
jgi:ABC-type dipeptide/oligopeptide/nickel transport system permease subunit